MVVSPSDLKCLAKTRGANLRSLEIRGCKMFSGDGLIDIARYCKDLRSLRLEHNWMENDYMPNGEWLHELALCNTVMESLKFHYPFDSYDMKDVTCLAKKCSNSLVSLNIYPQPLSNSREVFKHARKLDNFGYGIIDEDSDYNGFKFPPNIRGLRIQDLYEASFPFLLLYLNQLRELDLLYEDHTHNCQCFFFERCPNLEVLVTEDICGDIGLQVVGQFCKKLRKLTHYGRATHIGLITLAQGCPNLEYLAVTLLDISNEALECVGTHLKNLRDFRRSRLFKYLLQHLDNLNVYGSSTSHGSTSHGPSGGPVAYHSGPYGYYAPSLAQSIGSPLGFSYQPTQPDSSGHMDTSGQATVLPYAFTMGTLHDLASSAWNFDTGTDISQKDGKPIKKRQNRTRDGKVCGDEAKSKACRWFNLACFEQGCYAVGSSGNLYVFSVGDGHSIPVTNMGHSILPTPTRSLHSNNVLITPHIVKNLIYVHQFVRDNNCTIEFDVFGFSVKDFLTSRVLLRCDSTGDLYLITAPSPIPHAFLVSQHTWHQRLGHPGGEVLRRLVSSNFISCNKEKPLVLCHACQLGKHVRLPFVSSGTVISSCFDIIHSDMWTSPIPSLSGFKYYVLFLDHYSQFVWVYPLVNKSDVMSKFVLFHNYVRTQFKCEIKSF
ncbi:ribonuclease H-like domain-containing protein [Tanacetum coccineum]